MLMARLIRLIHLFRLGVFARPTAKPAIQPFIKPFFSRHFASKKKKETKDLNEEVYERWLPADREGLESLYFTNEDSVIPKGQGLYWDGTENDLLEGPEVGSNESEDKPGNETNPGDNEIEEDVEKDADGTDRVKNDGKAKDSGGTTDKKEDTSKESTHGSEITEEYVHKEQFFETYTSTTYDNKPPKNESMNEIRVNLNDLDNISLGKSTTILSIVLLKEDGSHYLKFNCNSKFR